MLYVLGSDLFGARPKTRSAGLHDSRRIYKDGIKLGSSTFNNNPDDPKKDDPEKDDPEKKDNPEKKDDPEKKDGPDEEDPEQRENFDGKFETKSSQ